MMKNFETPGMQITVLSGFSIIHNSNNELAIIGRIPSVNEAAEQDSE